MATEIVGLIPAAGHAARLGRMPCSKEICPVGYRMGDGGKATLIVAAEYLLEKFRAAGARKAFVVLREGKWDIPAYLGDGHRHGIQLAYLMRRQPFGTPFTIDAAYPFVRGAIVVFGFPDIVFDSSDAFVRLLERQAASGADVVLGLFPARRPEKMDMVELAEGGAVRAIVIKPERTRLRYTWIISAWTPVFSAFLHEHVADCLATGDIAAGADGRELYVGDVVQAAIDAGLKIDAVVFDNASYIDIGTPEDLLEAIRTGMSAGNEPMPPGGPVKDSG